MKIIIPMAGRGARFATGGTFPPKPLIPVGGRPMISWAMQSLVNLPRSRIIFVALAKHEKDYAVTGLLRVLAGPEAEVILLDSVTDGQLCTVLAARESISDDEDLLIASADTLVVSSLGFEIMRRTAECHGIISVADMLGDRWSFARTDASGRVVEVAEKRRISNNASTGLYYFSSGKEFVAVADEIISNAEKTCGEYYIIPVYQKYISRGWRVDISIAKNAWDMGTPESLVHFQRSFLA